MASRKRKFNLERRISIRATKKEIEKAFATMEKNPWIRYIVTGKKGRSRGTLMSCYAYEFLEKVVKKILADYDALSRAEQIAQAISLMQPDLATMIAPKIKPLPVELL